MSARTRVAGHPACGGALVAHRSTLLTALAIAILLGACIPSVIAAGTAHRADAQARSAVAALDAAQRGLRITTNSADDAQAQQLAAIAAIDGVLGDVAVLSTRMAYPLEARPAVSPGGAARNVILTYVADWAQHVKIVDGRAPRAYAVVEGAKVMEVVAPQASGMVTGESLLLGHDGLPVRVVGTWVPRDPGDALWFTDPGLAAGTVSDRRDAVGPLFTADVAAVNSAAERPLVRWTVVPDTQDLTAAGLARLALRLDAVPDALTAAGVIVQGATVQAQGGPHLAAIADIAFAARRQARSAFFLGIGVGGLGLLSAAAAFGARTRRERELLRARGARSGWLVLRDAPGVLSVGAVAGALGWVVATAAGGPGAAWSATGAAVLGATATLVTLTRRLPVDRARRDLLAGALTGVLIVSTALALWRLAATRDDPDVAASAAPVLLLVCAGLVAGRVLPVVARVGAVPARWARGLVPVLSARRVTRDPGPVPVIAAVAGGAVTFAIRSGADPTLHTGWTAAAAAAVVVGVVALTATVMAGRDERRADGMLLGALAAHREGVVARRTGLVVGLVVSSGTGVAVALVTVGLVLGTGVPS